MSTVLSGGSRRSASLALAVAFIAAVAMSLAYAHRASAAQEFYCNTDGSYRTVAAGDTCSGSPHALRRNYVFSPNGYQVCAGARDLSWNFYGSYICGYTNAEHCYGGGNTLYPLAHNSEAWAFSLRGTQEWGTVICPA